MKKLFSILLLFLIILISCDTPEKKVIKSFNEQRFSRDRGFKIEKAQIYDTLYVNQVIEKTPIIIDKVQSLENRIKRMDNFRDSVIKLNYPRPITDSLLRKGFDRKRFLDREIGHYRYIEDFYNNLYYDYNDTIAAYYARIITERDTFEFVVMARTYRILCPVFMIEE